MTSAGPNLSKEFSQVRMGFCSRMDCPLEEVEAWIHHRFRKYGKWDETCAPGDVNTTLPQTPSVYSPDYEIEYGYTRMGNVGDMSMAEGSHVHLPWHGKAFVHQPGVGSSYLDTDIDMLAVPRGMEWLPPGRAHKGENVVGGPQLAGSRKDEAEAAEDLLKLEKERRESKRERLKGGQPQPQPQQTQEPQEQPQQQPQRPVQQCCTLNRSPLQRHCDRSKMTL
eukprot:g54028.t1